MLLQAGTATELAAATAPWRRAGQALALVPTMGNLHDGHLDLVARAKALAERVVVSVFVNPLQFGPQDDFERYPRTLQADAAKLEAAGVDLLFAPSVQDMYPAGYPPAVSLQVAGPLDEALEGQFRPGHLDGVATVVHRLFARVQPQVAVFGEKDWQQLAMIRRMVRDFDLAVRIEGVTTRREADGLAMSSRNQYLTAEQRRTAPQLQAALQAIAAALREGHTDPTTVVAAQSARLAAAGFAVQYLEVRAPDLSQASAGGGEFVIMAAARLGATRLIDNLPIRLR